MIKATLGNIWFQYPVFSYSLLAWFWEGFILRLFLFRFSLTENDQLSLLDAANGSARDGKIETRLSFLKRVFEKDTIFEARKNTKLRYQHTQTDNDVYSGVICRWIPKEMESVPSDPFALEDTGVWEKSAIFFNAADDEQVLGIEHNNSIGKPSSVVKQFVTAINALNESRPYKVDAFSINVKSEFKKAVLDYSGQVTFLSFDLVVPNPTNAEGKTKKALKSLRKITNGDRYKAAVSSSEGLDVNNNLVKGIVAHAESGNGDVLAKDGKTKIYDSKESNKTVEIDDELRPDGQEKAGLADSVSDKLKK